MKFNQLLLTLSISILTFTSCKKSTPDANCDNGLLRTEYNDCKCNISDGYILPTHNKDAECRSLKANEWILTFNDADYPFKKLVFEYLDKSKVSYPNEYIDGYESEYQSYSLTNPNFKQDGKKGVSGSYYISYDQNGNASIVIDFRYRWAENDNSAFNQSTKEGYFITLQMINGQPTNVRLNRGKPSEIYDNREVSSYTPITVLK